MTSYEKLLLENKAWAGERLEDDPDYFNRLADIQTPEFLWIGCSDSRVPANEITGTQPGEIFVHRNIANMVVHSDMNMLSVLDYAVSILKVKHVIVCGHYGCGGVLAALQNNNLGLIDNWLRHVQDVRSKHRSQIDSLTSEAEQHVRLCELNVIEQVKNVARTDTVVNAWSRGNALAVHGWIYDVTDGLLRDLNITIMDNP